MADDEQERTALYEDQRRKIIDSVFSRRNGSSDETYVSHVKIWDGAGPGDKPRYILLSQGTTGTGYIHKSKLNQNETFSVGKTWVLSDLKAIVVTSPTILNITLSRSYQWQCANATEQTIFIDALVKLFRTVTGGAFPLRLEGFRDPDTPRTGSRQPVQTDYLRSSVASPNGTRPQPGSRSQTPTQIDRESRTQSRPSSPARSNRPRQASRARPQSPAPRPRPASPVSSPSRRRPSNAASTMSQIPTNGMSQAPNRSQSPITTRPAVNGAPPSPVIQPAPAPRPRRTSPTPSTRTQRAPTRTASVAGAAPARRDPLARISFFDPPNQASIDRFVSNGLDDTDGEDENAQATMANVEEMLEGYELASDDVIGRKTAGAAGDMIEARLLDELMALEKANIHSFLEADDRIAIVLKFMDDAMAELENMGSLISSYKIHLNTAADDILYIQSQNRGLQVQTQNQRALLDELENLLQTVQVDKGVLVTLTQESMDTGIQRLEEAAAELYKALQAGRETDMAATMERLQEYRTHNSQFCKRIFDYLSLRFNVQSQMLLGDNNGLTSPGVRGGRPVPAGHQDLEAYLGRYSGLMLYLKEMDDSMYGKLCVAYFSAASELHNKQIKAMLSTYLTYVKKKPAEEDGELGFSLAVTPSSSKTTAGMRRAGTLIRSPLEARREKEKVEGDMIAADVFGLVLEQIATLVYREDDFITSFLQVNDTTLTFADYMGLDNYFRRQATRSVATSQSTSKLVRGAMDLIFGFLPQEVKAWVDMVLARDNNQIFGVIVCLERFLADADERGSDFFFSVLGKQHTRLKGLFDRHINEQVQSVEQTKITSKKRKGVAPFVKFFPLYIGRVESQLIGSDGLEIRANVDAAYDRIVQSMFESLKQMAKMDGEGEDKGQLNYHVILIENMHHFVAETSQLEIGSVVGFLKRAEAIYDENLSAYVKIVLRRPFSKIIDYFEGVERLLKTTAPTEIANNGSYTKSALKKVIKEYSAKDIRKHVDVLFKRVEKHFTESSDKVVTEENRGIAPGSAMAGVWRACEEEVLRITELFSKRISQCYSDSGVSLDYTVTDIEAAFRRHRGS
ncbi:exocyst complex component Sec3-domain-containing protein [Mycena floridula]|nr:exocyst complex component Sec3-domain-containing protein [Mycena floridula]